MLLEEQLISSSSLVLLTDCQALSWFLRWCSFFGYRLCFDCMLHCPTRSTFLSTLISLSSSFTSLQAWRYLNETSAFSQLYFAHVLPHSHSCCHSLPICFFFLPFFLTIFSHISAITPHNFIMNFHPSVIYITYPGSGCVEPGVYPRELWAQGRAQPGHRTQTNTPNHTADYG